MKKYIGNLAQKKSIRELFKYGLVGIGGLIIEMTIFYLLTKKFAVHYPFSSSLSDFLGNRMSIHVINTDTSHVISSAAAIINNFILNSYFTFKVTDKKVRRFFTFIGVAAVGLVISTTLMTIFVGKFGMDEMLSKALALAIVVAIQFLVNKFFTFKQHNNENSIT